LFSPHHTTDNYILSLHDALPIFKNIYAIKRFNFDALVYLLIYISPFLPLTDEALAEKNRIIDIKVIFKMYGKIFTSKLLYYYESDRKSTRLNSSHVSISYAVFCL